MKYGKGINIMKRKLISIALTFCLTLCLIGAPVAFAEAGPSSWAEEQVGEAIAAGFVPHYLQFDYTEAATRAEFCALAVALYEKMTASVITERVKFIDTNDVNVEKAAAIGVVSDVGDNKFAPDAELTREQAATMLVRLVGRIASAPLTRSTPTFADSSSISLWAREGAGLMQASGIMGGVGGNTFAPKSPYTKEQSIVTILRARDYIIVFEQEKEAMLAEFADRVHTLSNAERAKVGLSPFGKREQLSAAAAIRALELEVYYSHDRPDGSDCLTVLDELGIRYSAAGENIAMYQRTPEEVIKDWMNSPGHKANILHRSLGNMGVGVHMDSSGRLHWVQLFTN